MPDAPLVLLLSGPNLSLLGAREPAVYGTATLADHVAAATAEAAACGLDLEHVQGEAEADLVRAVHGARGRAAAIVVNPGALTHYGWSLHDALAAFDGPVVELHLSNPDARALAPHLGDRPGGHRRHRRLRRPRLPPGHHRRRDPPLLNRSGRRPPGPARPRVRGARAGGAA